MCKLGRVCSMDTSFTTILDMKRGSTFFALLLLLVFAATASGLSSKNVTNPYFYGCLRELVPGWDKPRVCLERIDDSDSTCLNSPFDYMEIRIASGNWDSATALGWLVQIILSEMLGVPSSMESNMYGSSRDFYDPQGAIDYDRGIGPEPLEVAAGLPDGDCRALPKASSDDDYLACAHFQPEFWGNPLQQIVDQTIEPPQGTGFLGMETWFVTKFTADEYPQFVSYHGFQESNRELLASVFKRPTTWLDYCQDVSLDNCTTPDNVALRAPLDEIEAAKMFDPEEYMGHFRYTDANDCTLFPTNCTGHIANYPCGWSSNMEANIFHLGMPLQPNNGPDGAPNGYTADQLREMWHAANATRSHLMMMWWKPEPLYQQYLDTPAEMQQVMLKPYTLDCANARAEWKNECSEDQSIRVGAPEEACDNPIEPLRKLINVGLREVLESPEIPDEARSPAYDVLRLFQIESVQLGELFDLIREHQDTRKAVCTWASENIDVLKAFIPHSYPRVYKEEAPLAFGYVATAFGAAATLFILVIWQAVYRNRDRPAIQYAQFDFLSILLMGSFLVSIGSILLGLPASNGSCVASIWFVYLGYNLVLVPLIVKVAAINRMMEAAREMRRFVIPRVTLYKAVAFIEFCVVVFLACWTALDPPQQEAEYTMTDTKTEKYDEHIVEKRYHCSSPGAWQFSAVAWNAVLLACASVLAYQSRNVLQKFNESRTLAVLIYSHSVFVVLRIVTFLLADSVKGSTLDYARSLIYALDQIATAIIYFLPKLTVLDRDDSADDSHDKGRRVSGMGILKGGSEMNRFSGQSGEFPGEQQRESEQPNSNNISEISEDPSQGVPSRTKALTEETAKKSDPSINVDEREVEPLDA